MLEIKNLTKIYENGKKAVDFLNLSIESGDIYGFIGSLYQYHILFSYLLLGYLLMISFLTLTGQQKCQHYHLECLSYL